MLQNSVECRGCSTITNRSRREGWWDRNGTRTGAATDEVLKALLQAGTKAFEAAVQFDSGACRQSAANFRFREVENQVVGAKAWNVGFGVKTFQRIVKVVGQKDRLDVALVEHRFGPLRRCHDRFAAIVECFPIVQVQPIFFEAKERAANFDQPTVLGRVFKRLQTTH